LSLDSGLVLSVIPADVEAWRRQEGTFFKTIHEDAIPVAA
jgi:hypothetical protein